MTVALDFEAWWQAFPRKVGKLAARKEYEKVRRAGISAEELLDGISTYKATKPPYADWCHPRTFLSQGRWLDEPDTPQASAEFTCQHEPRHSGRHACWLRSEIDKQRKAP